MMKRFLFVLFAVMALFFASISTAEYGNVVEPELKADLSGAEVVPPVKTDASGKASFTLNKERTLLFYKVTVSNIEGVTAAHIHMGQKGQDGSPIALIKITTKQTGKLTGTLAEGSIGPQDLMTSFKGKDIQALYQQLLNGDTYVNIHTVKYPNGEIRGQIKY